MIACLPFRGSVIESIQRHGKQAPRRKVQTAKPGGCQGLANGRYRGRKPDDDNSRKAYVGCIRRLLRFPNRMFDAFDQGRLPRRRG
jgi:hypothetical protein